MTLPPWAVEFLRRALAAPGHKALLCCGRKNAKSAITAVLMLGYLVGPLRAAGSKGAVASMTFRRTPYPGGKLADTISRLAEATENRERDEQES